MFPEYETRKRENSGGEKSSEQSWEWGKMPKSADHSGKDDTDGKDKVRTLGISKEVLNDLI